jgi:hypothetical protein
LLEIIKETAYKTLPSVNASPAALYRSIDSEEPPTILYDEADTKFGSSRAAEGNEDLRALLNAGHSQGWPILRCVGPNQEVKAFASFAMAAIAGIGALPDTITDRAVNIRMRRRNPTTEKVKPSGSAATGRRCVPSANGYTNGCGRTSTRCGPPSRTCRWKTGPPTPGNR